MTAGDAMSAGEAAGSGGAQMPAKRRTLAEALGPVAVAAEREWTPELLAALAADERVVGAASLAWDRFDAREARLVIATTWDGLDAVTADLARLGALAVGGEAHLACPALQTPLGPAWTAVTASARRIEIAAVRIGDLKPGRDGVGAVAVVDPRGVIDQWARWSANRTTEGADVAPPDGEAVPGRPASDATASRRFLEFDEVLRSAETRMARGRIAAVHAWAFLRAERSALDLANPVHVSLAARADAVLAVTPGPGTGLRPTFRVGDPAATLERFYLVADGEGFLGDRFLFNAASKQLAELSRRAPVFDEGFVVPTFDAVEVRWRFGDGVGGCKVPLVPAVHVGVGVTPEDHLEFWAAPAVREPGCSVACVADLGARTVVPRTAGKDALLAALADAVDDAWDRLPALLRAARRAAKITEADPAAAWKPLHLPKSFTGAARRALEAGPSRSRLALALALARAGDDAAPLIARKLGLAAGRLLWATPTSAAPGDDAACSV